MLTTNEVAQVFDTILSSPGMNEAVRIDLRISRKNVLLLNHIIERGLSLKGDEGSLNLFAAASGDTLEELKTLASDCLQKAGLVELSEKLAQLSSAGKK
ncbi:hypothetical protein [Flavobacterium beibuense]|uniref:Uncharacterized protein n=1 Tax=Flavobacterium beibuense TaxID=657326 RepID=A0A444WEK1_9FLAO|nr:hypothetical protein [Flavobacterium beibuense]RYJ44281.1 hypothetical protein NU09_0891 [Flavobacterium beibuense]